MPFCQNCGTQVDENARFCPNCRSQVGPPQEPAQPPHQPAQQYHQPAQQPNVFQRMNTTTETTSQYSPKDIEDNKVMAALSYLGILVLVTWFAAPNSPFARFHAKQGINLFVAYIGYAIVSFLLGLIRTTHYIWGVPYRATPGIIVLLIWLIGIPLFILSIIGIVNAVKGRAKELPIIGKFKLVK